MKKVFLLLLISIFYLNANCQCDTIYHANTSIGINGQSFELDIQPEYKSGDLGNKYMNEVGMYLNSNCESTIKHHVDHKVYASLIIDTLGQIQEVTLYNYDFDEDCRDFVLNWFKTLDGWSPAVENGQKVCARLRIVLNVKIYESR